MRVLMLSQDDVYAALAPGDCERAMAEVLKAKGFQTIPAGERLVVEMPGGGGFGDPKKRDRTQVARDVKLGVVAVAQSGESTADCNQRFDQAVQLRMGRVLRKSCRFERRT